MANEIIYSGIGDLTVAAVLATTVDLILSDRETGVLSHPVLLGSEAQMAAPGSLVCKVPRVGLMGYDGMTTGTEGTAPANTALTDGFSSITLAIREKIYQGGDLARFTAGGILNAQMMAMDCGQSVALDLLELLAALASGFSGNVAGTSGAALTNADLLDAVTMAEVAGHNGLLMGLLDPVQVGHVRTDGLSLGGAVQHRADAQGFVKYAGGQFLGNLYNVDWFKSSKCPTSDAGVNVNGMLIGAGALYWGRGQFAPEFSPGGIIELAAPGSPVTARLEIERDGRAGLTSWIMRHIVGVIEGQDAAGVRIRSKATT